MVLEVVHVLFDWQETVNQLTLIWVNTFGHEPKCTVLKSLEQYLNCIAKQNSSRIVVCITTTWCKWWLAKPSVRATAHKTCKVTEEQVFVTGAHSRMTWWAESNNRIDSKQVTARCHIKATDKWHACKTQTDRPGFSSSQCHLIACQTSKTTAVSQQASKQHSCGHHCVILHPKIKKDAPQVVPVAQAPPVDTPGTALLVVLTPVATATTSNKSTARPEDDPHQEAMHILKILTTRYESLDTIDHHQAEDAANKVKQFTTPVDHLKASELEKIIKTFHNIKWRWSLEQTHRNFKQDEKTQHPGQRWEKIVWKVKLQNTTQPTKKWSHKSPTTDRNWSTDL